MAITDLTGYTWVGNASLNQAWGIYSINFTCNNISYIQFRVILDDSPYSLAYANSSATTTVYKSSGWYDEAYKTIQITGGTDATDSTLIAWLEANGTLTAPASSDTIKFGSSAISALKLGSADVDAVYFGSNKLYEKASSGYSIAITRTDSRVWTTSIYDGTDNTGTLLGTMVGGDTQTYTISSGNIYIKLDTGIGLVNCSSSSGITLTGGGDYFQYVSYSVNANGTITLNTTATG